MSYSKKETTFLMALSPVKAVEYPARVPPTPFSKKENARLNALSPVRFARQTTLSGNCGCGCDEKCQEGLSGPLTSYFCSESEAVKNAAEEINKGAMISAVAAGALGGLLGSIFRRPLIGILGGAAMGFVSYHTQKATV